jgi:hypothetical protein
VRTAGQRPCRELVLPRSGPGAGGGGTVRRFAADLFSEETQDIAPVDRSAVPWGADTGHGSD